MRIVAWNADDKDKPALLLVHGFLASSHWWDAIAPAFVDRFRVFACDLSGMGDSTHRPAYAHRAWSEEIVAVARTVAPGGVHIVGHSFGGTRSLEACALHADQFAQLVLVDSYVHLGSPVPTRQGTWSANTEIRSFPDLQTALSRYRLVPNEAVPTFMLDHVARHAAVRHGSGWGWKFDPHLLSQPRSHDDARSMLETLRVPLTVVRGAHSSIATASQMASMSRLCPVAQPPVIVPGAGHHLPLTHPVELTAVLCDVLVPPLPAATQSRAAIGSTCLLHPGDRP